MFQKPLSIIIADDDFDEIDLLKAAFEKNSQFEIIGCAYNGQEIIDLVRTSKKIPDVIFTDMYMPVLTGLEAIEILRMDEKNSEVRFVIFSTSINPSIIEKASYLGIVGTLLKPFQLEEYQTLPSKVTSMLEANN